MEYVSKAGQAAYEHLGLPAEDQARSQQEQAKRRQERIEQWQSRQAHELKTGEAALVLAELERLRTLMQQMDQLAAVETVDKSLHRSEERRVGKECTSREKQKQQKRNQGESRWPVSSTLSAIRRGHN